MNKYKKLLCLFLIFSLFSTFPSSIFAETTTQQPLTQAEKDQLEQQLKDIENQIAQYQQELSGIRSEKNTLANKIKQLKIQQSSLSLQIKQTTLNIKNTEAQIDQTTAEIEDNQKRLATLRSQIAQVIFEINERDRVSTAEILLSDGGLSGFFQEYNSYEILNKRMADTMDAVRGSTAALHDEQDRLADQQEQQQNLISLASVQNQSLADSISDQNSLLQTTKGREADYQIVINDTRRKANEIRGRIYQLTGGGPTTQVTFGQAVTIAQSVSSMTGVRAAFLLAVLTQESNLGKNVGTCNRAGDPPEKSWRVIMKPTRDQEPFQVITTELGLDIETTPVSCPMRDKKGNQVGWGGAMGPAQFIPSTWMGYREKVSALTGKPANPWDIQDAFIAAAIKLKADGAGTQSGEWAAAMKYFSGSTNLAYRFYGDNVVKLAAGYQEDIDALGQ